MDAFCPVTVPLLFNVYVIPDADLRIAHPSFPGFPPAPLPPAPPSPLAIPVSEAPPFPEDV